MSSIGASASSSLSTGMMPTTGPKVSSRITSMSWVTSTGPRHNIDATADIGRELCRINQRAGARRLRIPHMATDSLGEAAGSHRTEGCFRIKRVAEREFLDPGHCALDKAIIEAAVHIDALNPAAALAGIKNRTIRNAVGGGGSASSIT